MSARLLLAEDEAPQRDALRAMLGRLWPDAEVLVAEDGLEALERLQDVSVDLAFLDVRMPGASGLEVAERVLATGGAVVFTTAYEAYAVRAFEQGAVDYLLKPVTEARLAQAIERWRQRNGHAIAAEHTTTRRGDAPAIDLATLAALLREGAPLRLRWISASLGDTVRLVGVDDVQAFHAEDKMTRVLTATGDALIRSPLKELLPQLDPDVFWQVHRSLIVQVSAIEHVRRDELGRGVLTLKGRLERFAVSQGAMPRFRGL